MEELRRRSYSNGSYSKGSYSRGNRNYVRSRYTAGRTQQKSDVNETILAQCIVCGIILIFALVISLFDFGITNSIRSALKTALSNDANVGSVVSGVDGLTQRYAGIKNSLNIIFGKTPDEENLFGSDNFIEANDSLREANSSLSAEFNEDTVSPGDSGAIEADVIEAAAIVPEEVSREASGQELIEQEATTREVFSRTGDGAGGEAVRIIDENFRIDEDILEQISSRVDFYNSGSKIPQ